MKRAKLLVLVPCLVVTLFAEPLAAGERAVVHENGRVTDQTGSALGHSVSGRKLVWGHKWHGYPAVHYKTWRGFKSNLGGYYKFFLHMKVSWNRRRRGGELYPYKIKRVQKYVSIRATTAFEYGGVIGSECHTGRADSNRLRYREFVSCMRQTHWKYNCPGPCGSTFNFYPRIRMKVFAGGHMEYHTRG